MPHLNVLVGPKGPKFATGAQKKKREQHSYEWSTEADALVQDLFQYCTTQPSRRCWVSVPPRGRLPPAARSLSLHMAWILRRRGVESGALQASKKPRIELQFDKGVTPTVFVYVGKRMGGAM